MMAATLLSLFCTATPSVGLGLGQATERLEVTGAHETRRLLTSSLALGLEYPLADGALEPDDAFQQVNDLRRDAFESLPESESEAAKRPVLPRPRFPIR